MAKKDQGKEVDLKSFAEHAALSEYNQDALKYRGDPDSEYTEEGYRMACQLMDRGAQLREQGYSENRLSAEDKPDDIAP